MCICLTFCQIAVLANCVAPLKDSAHQVSAHPVVEDNGVNPTIQASPVGPCR